SLYLEHNNNGKRREVKRTMGNGQSKDIATIRRWRNDGPRRNYIPHRSARTRKFQKEIQERRQSQSDAYCYLPATRALWLLRIFSFRRRWLATLHCERRTSATQSRRTICVDERGDCSLFHRKRIY